MQISSRNSTTMVCSCVLCGHFISHADRSDPMARQGMVIKVKRHFYGPIDRVNENAIRILLIEFNIRLCVGWWCRLSQLLCAHWHVWLPI